MHFNIPQFIDVEDRIVGPFTLKQFLIVAGAGVFLFFIWYIFKFWIFILMAIPIGSGVLALAFIKIDGRPLTAYLFAWLKYIRRPKLYVWRKR